MRQRFSRQLCRGLGHGAWQRTASYLRSNFSDHAIELSIEEGAAVKDSPGFREEKTRASQLQFLDDLACLISQILCSTGQENSRRNVARFRGGCHHWKYLGKNITRPASRTIKQLVELTLECFKNFPAQWKCLAVEMLLKTHGNCFPADIVRAPRIANHRPKPARARYFDWGVPSQNRRTRPCNHHNTGNLPRGSKGEQQVARNTNSCIRKFRLQARLDRPLHAGLGCSRKARKEVAYILLGFSDRAEGFRCRYGESGQSRFQAESRGVGRARARPRENRAGLVHQYTIRLRAPAIKSENIAHGKSISENV